MSRRELPPETDHQTLDFQRLIETLDVVEGEIVIVRITPRHSEADDEAGVASMVGQLRHVPARYPGHEFSIADPYPADYPEHLGGGVLFLNEASFETATLHTFDGNDYFMISITTHPVEILIQDADSTYP